MLSERIKLFRQARGLSLEELSETMGMVVTRSALSQYEKGQRSPSARVLREIAKALAVSTEELLREPEIHVECLKFRKLSGTTVRSQEEFKSLVTTELENRVRIQRLVCPEIRPNLPIRNLKVQTIDEAESAAEGLRRIWNVGRDPIGVVTDLLEEHGVHVIEVDADSDSKYDGLSALAKSAGEVCAVATVSRKGVCGERQRLNLAHELGHLVLDPAPGVDEEKAAFRFAGAFLAPAEAVMCEVGNHRAHISMAELLILKRKFGISLQALLRRLKDLHIISDTYFTAWHKELNWRGLKKREPNESPAEEPTWFHQSVLRAVAEGFVPREEGERLLGRSLEFELPLAATRQRMLRSMNPDEREKLLMQSLAGYEKEHEYDRAWVEAKLTEGED